MHNEIIFGVAWFAESSGSKNKFEAAKKIRRSSFGIGLFGCVACVSPLCVEPLKCVLLASVRLIVTS